MEHVFHWSLKSIFASLKSQTQAAKSVAWHAFSQRAAGPANVRHSTTL
jgi:hypothetical protein